MPTLDVLDVPSALDRKHEPDPEPGRLHHPTYGVPAGHTRCLRCGCTFPVDGPIPGGRCEVRGAAWARMAERDERATVR
ncbi:hypothetical protein [Pseudonocardia sp. NPDC049635]|uniref:hypothetical protein n=1 Tax=Pseudonocardia sp. NPDC049635 TaxID=3155506 RepID=UPI0033ECA003